MKNQAFNPYLPSYEYIPDGEPHIFGDRLYVYGSHDRFGGDDYCLNDYVCWSAPTSDLSDWRYEGVIYRKDQHPHKGVKNMLYAPDVAQGPDGRYYLYYTRADSFVISVAVCDTPAGQYSYYGDVHAKNGHVYGMDPSDWFEFDPAVLVDDDGRIWLYSGTGQKSSEKLGRPVVGAFVKELEPDMITAKSEPRIIMGREKRDHKKPAFFEGASIRKVNGLYYFVYPSTDFTGLHYCTSKYPDRAFVYRGRIHSTSDIGMNGYHLYKPAYPYGNNHGGIACVNGKYYIFDHRMTNRTFYSRQGVAEEIEIRDDGFIKQVESTSCGLNGGPLRGIGTYPAYIACNLQPRRLFGFNLPDGPYMTQEGGDREDNPDQHIAGITHRSLAGFKYFLFDGNCHNISVRVRGEAKGKLHIRTSQKGKDIACLKIDVHSHDWQDICGAFSTIVGKYPLYFLYKGTGTLDMMEFTLG